MAQTPPFVPLVLICGKLCLGNDLPLASGPFSGWLLSSLLQTKVATASGKHLTPFSMGLWPSTPGSFSSSQITCNQMLLFHAVFLVVVLGNVGLSRKGRPGATYL